MEELCETENSNPFVTTLHQRLSTIYQDAGKNCLKNGQPDRARELLLKALTHNERNIDTVISLFQFHKARYDVERCQKVCLDYLALDPRNETIVLLLTSIVTRKLKDLIPHIKNVLEVHPRFYRTLVRLIEICARSGKLEEALVFIKASESDDPGYLFIQGLYASYNGSVDTALRWFEKAARNSKWQVAANMAIAELLINPERKYLWLEKESLAIRENLSRAERIRKGLKIDEATKSLLAAEIFCSYNTDDSIDQAMTIFRKVLDDISGNIAATVGIARIYLRRGELDKSSKMLDFVFAGKPFHDTFSYFEEAYLMRAQIVTTETNFRSAQHFIFLALDLNMSCKKGWEMSAKVHAERNMFTEASQAYGKCWELGDRHDPEMGYNYAYCTMKSKRYESALSICREVMDLYPGYKDLREKVAIPSFRKMKR
jgi:tetratricopeptide repeat protein 21B